MRTLDFGYMHQLISDYEDLKLFELSEKDRKKKIFELNSDAFYFIKKNKKSVIKFFIETISEIEKNYVNNSEQYYLSEIEKIKAESIPEETEKRISKFHKKLAKYYREDSSLFRSTIDYNRLNKNDLQSYYLRVGILLFRQLNLSFPYIERIQEIINFKYSTELSFIYYHLYKYLKGEKTEVKLKPTLTHYALFYYYIHESREQQRFENHPKGKIGALKELISRKNIPSKSYKSFQLKYNQVSNSRMNRIASSRKTNLAYVIKNMLDEYPKAKKIAIEEYELDITKSK